MNPIPANRHALHGTLPPCARVQEVALSRHTARPQQPLPQPPAHAWDRIDGSPWMQRHDLESGSLLRFPDLADFLVDAQGIHVDAWPTPKLDADACEQLFRNNVLPMAQSRQGGLVLHASAVVIGAQAAVFIGESGLGKSTLATSFARSGHPLIVDDGLVVDVASDNHPIALLGEQALRLCADSLQHLIPQASDSHPVGYTAKRSIPGSDALPFSPHPVPIGAIFLLGKDRQASLCIRPLPPAKALIELIHHSFLLDSGEPECHAVLMRSAARLTNACRVFSLDYPRSYDQLPAVIEAVAHRCLPLHQHTEQLNP